MYGIMLLVMDLRIDGILRERLLVAYHRYMFARNASLPACVSALAATPRPSSKTLMMSASWCDRPASRVPQVPRYIASTWRLKPVLTASQRPADYPEAFFARIPIDKSFIKMLITRLHSDDIYNQACQ